MSSARVVVDAAVRLDEAHDPALVQLVQLVDARPRRQRDATIESRGTGPGRRGPHSARRSARSPARTWSAHWGLIVHHDTAVLEVVHLELPGDRPRVDTPGRDVGKMRPRGRGVRVVRHVRRLGRRDVRRCPRLGTNSPGTRPARARVQPAAHADDDQDRDGRRRPPEPPSLAARQREARRRRRAGPAGPPPRFGCPLRAFAICLRDPPRPARSRSRPRPAMAEARGSRTHLELV